MYELCKLEPLYNMNFSIAKFSILVFSFKFVNVRLRVFEKKEDVMRFAY